MVDRINEEDQILLKGCLENDRRIQRRLFEKYFKKMFRICLSYSGDKNEAKDILQEAFIKVFTGLDKFDSRGSLEGWIRRIVTNTAIDFFRQRKKIVYTSAFSGETDEDEDEDEHVSNLFQELTNDVILHYIRKLPDGARVVFNLFAVDGMSHREISKKLNISEGTSKSQYKRARGLLQKWLCDYQQNMS